MSEENKEIISKYDVQEGGLNLWYEEVTPNSMKFSLHVKNVLLSKQTKFQKLDIMDTTAFGRIMTLDGLMMVSDRDECTYHEMISHIPLLTHPDPKKVLIIGGGDGGTLTQVLKHPGVEKAVLCEIDGDVVQSAKDFFPKLAEGMFHKNAEVVVGDGVKYVKDTADNTFDVVLVDSTDPIGPGVGLFSTEFYADVKRILKDDGIVAAQCESPWEDKVDLRKVYQNLKDNFKSVYSYMGSIPSYPYGQWTWGIATNGVDPREAGQSERAKKIAEGTRYYTQDIHKAAFAIPKFLLERLENIIEN